MNERTLTAPQAIQTFLDTPLERHLAGASLSAGQEAMVSLFHQVVASVPAYGVFLKQHGVSQDIVSNWTDFQRLPMMNKPDYTLAYELSDLCWGGTLSSTNMMAVSSGSTGVPGFWPRGWQDELAIVRRFEQVFVDSFKLPQRRTLAVVCFALGTWVGGMFTAQCLRLLALKDYPLMVVTPGNNPGEIFRILKALGPQFDQVVLLGYPPFLKEVVDQGIHQGVKWPDYQVKWVMAGEVFSESWRSLMAERLGSVDPACDSASLYGTADAGVLGNETPLSITIRRFLSERPALARKCFGEDRLPTLVQYDPRSRYFETHDGTLLFSGDNGIPLIRYHIADKGGVMPYGEMMAFLQDEAGFDPVATVTEKAPVRDMPFVYVFGRANFTISYYGANIYPEQVSVGLEQEPLQHQLSGKFVMGTQEDADGNVVWFVVIEGAPGVRLSPPEESQLVGQVAQMICAQVAHLNSEFAHYVPRAAQSPQVAFRFNGDPVYFPVGVKHRYTRPDLSCRDLF